LQKRIGKKRAHFSMAVLLLVAYMMPGPVWAWGRIGHRVAAKLAEDRLTPAARAAVRDILGPGVGLADVSTWADEQREIEESYRWHFVNVPISAERYDSRYCSPKGCVVGKIEEFRRILQNPGAEKLQRQQALTFLIHLITDLHQPLHVGDNNDQGGNHLQVRFFGTGSNLHRVWDSQVMERHTNNEKVWLWDFDFVANPKLVAQWSKGVPEDWATESLLIAKEAYRLPGSGNAMRSGARLGNEYYRFALPVIRSQLAKAGIRIAFVLNSIFR
jgi:nuclease S1